MPARRLRRAAMAALMAGAGACSFQPKHALSTPPIPAGWPANAQDGRAREAGPEPAEAVFVNDPRLRELIGKALAGNADIRLALANIEAARSQYRISRAGLLPEIDATSGYARTDAADAGGATGGSRTQYSVQLGVTAFEIDLFGRLRSLKDASLNRFLASEEAARAVRLTLIGDVAQAWLRHAANAQLLQVAGETRDSAEASVALTRARLQRGVIPRSDLRQAETILKTAEADMARLRTAVAQDANALQRLVGEPVSAELLPTDILDALAGLGRVRPGLSSTVLLRRPDVLAAEYELRASDGDIGVARAELFPVISLTGLLGFSSPALSSLIAGDSFSYSVGADARQSIFRGGGARANVALAGARQQAALASYQRAVQLAFQEAADALARADTLAGEIEARQATVAAADDNAAVADMRYRRGLDPFLSLLDARRNLYAARQELIAVQLADGSNRIALYQALGGEAVP